MYEEKDINWINSLNAICARPHLFFKDGKYDENILSENIAHEALVLGAKCIEIKKKDSYTIISADIDWLNLKTLHYIPITEIFNTLGSFPEDGENSHRSEILLTALCTEVCTFSKNDYIQVKGAKLNQEMLISSVDLERFQRSIAFKL